MTNYQIEAIKYFAGWEEGDNITVTADFVEYAETLKELLGTQNRRVSHWNNYIEYLKDWARQHEENEYEGMSPVCYDEFLDNEEGGEYDE